MVGLENWRPRESSTRVLCVQPSVMIVANFVRDWTDGVQHGFLQRPTRPQKVPVRPQPQLQRAAQPQPPVGESRQAAPWRRRSQLTATATTAFAQRRCRKNRREGQQRPGDWKHTGEQGGGAAERRRRWRQFDLCHPAGASYSRSVYNRELCFLIVCC